MVAGALTVVAGALTVVALCHHQQYQPMSEPPTCFLDLPHDAVRLILASLDTWTTAVDDLNFLRWWCAMKLCCGSLYSICKAYEPQLCKAAMVACRATLILTPNDGHWHYGYHALLPYCKMDPKPEQMTKIPETLLEQSDFLRTCRMVRLDGAGLPHPSDLRWMLWNLYRASISQRPVVRALTATGLAICSLLRPRYSIRTPAQ